MLQPLTPTICTPFLTPQKKATCTSFHPKKKNLVLRTARVPTHASGCAAAQEDTMRDYASAVHLTLNDYQDVTSVPSTGARKSRRTRPLAMRHEGAMKVQHIYVNVTPETSGRTMGRLFYLVVFLSAPSDPSPRSI